MASGKASTLEKVYDPAPVEKRWWELWEKNKVFAPPDDLKGRPPFCIVIPPPNVTGSLHMGHALNNTLQDILIRYHRMQGHATLWVFGMDHAGIATQNVVERQLKADGKSRHDMGREAFIKRVWQWREESGGTIRNQLKNLGASLDYDHERFTMDEGLSRAVKEVFVRLFEEGKIYRAQRLINWCPRCHTALSDLEVEHEEINGHLWHIRYPLEADPQDGIVVATTRPETLLGDTAVAVHPEDERYRNFIGKNVVVPFVDRLIPILADPMVDRKFGSGAVKITPAHDFNDFEAGNRHNLERVNLFTEDARMNEAAGPFMGKDRFECRQEIVKALEEKGQLIEVEDYKTAIGHCYRCKTVVEPYLSMQWFVKTGDLAKRAAEAVKQGKTRIIPQQWENTYFRWMEDIKDWCISRQIWWGHRIPVWYCGRCADEEHPSRGIIVSREEVTHCPHCGHNDLQQENDVLDTWFSSALWPFSTLGWPEQTPRLKHFYPTSTLVTGFDIIFFWVARMMMMALHFTGEVPFRDVYIHALVRDAEGQKMSKSKGNVIDPLEVMEQYGTDAFRFTLAALAAQGRDVKLSEDIVLGYRNFCNKIWNASRFLFASGMEYLNEKRLKTGLEKVEALEAHHEFSQWIISESSQCVADVRKAVEEYRFNEGAMTAYHFFWGTFCDWYLELIKETLKTGDSKLREEFATVAFYVLDQSLRLLHPFIPFITEELWQ
ncbi:MAG: valine--tRNA ligase, partial [bacterium]|nr:valine--tRNA ligase [bacterium]